MPTGDIVKTLEGHTASIYSLAIDSSGKTAVSAHLARVLKERGIARNYTLADFHDDMAALKILFPA